MSHADSNGDLAHDPFWYNVFRFCFRCYFKIIGIEIHGLEHIPAHGAAIIAPNHITGMDPFAVGQTVPRRVHFMTKKEAFASPIGNWFFRNGNGFPVDRSKADIGAIKHAVRLLQNKQILVIFPQGTRHGSGEAKEGVGMIASMAKVPVVPAGIHLSPNWFGAKKFVLRFGPAIAPQGNKEALTAQIKTAIDALTQDNAA